jgi:D-3-phosphoglycerate dehydrogenase|tara:strand:- start:34 stop:966 length:933 start_codon:yes stop_codon:yes gene_type:complete
MKILICDKLDTLAVENLQELGDCIDVSNEKNKEALIEENIADADILLVRSGTNITKELIDKANSLKIIARCGVGIDNIEISEATKKNIFVTNTPNANIISAAELTIGLMIAAARNISIADNSLKNKEWSRSEFTGIELYGKQLGLVGFGKVARLVSERLQSFGMKVVFYDPFVESSTEVEQKLNLNELLETSDFVSLHVPKTDETKNLISKDKLSIMKSNAIIINASRGGVIDEDAVFELVNQNKLFSAGFDVYENEPPNLDKESINSKAITLPHLGASTKEAQQRTGKEVVDNIKDILSGDLTSVLNKK